jgi:hypothetical protein
MSKIEHILTATDIDINFVSSIIPIFMNALYDEQSLMSVTLEEIRDAFRLKQIQSKSWLLEKIKDNDKDSPLLVIGSWLGFTSLCLYKLGFKHIDETDPDKRLSRISNHVNRFNKEFRHYNEDVNNLDLTKYKIIINTSCEHIDNNSWYNNIPSGTKLFLHSNNLLGYDHVNICQNLEEMIDQYPMKLSYGGSLDFHNYKRFMLVGEKY